MFHPTKLCEHPQLGYMSMVQQDESQVVVCKVAQVEIHGPGIAVMWLSFCFLGCCYLVFSLKNVSIVQVVWPLRRVAKNCQVLCGLIFFCRKMSTIIRKKNLKTQYKSSAESDTGRPIKIGI